ncbi:MAG TPA: RNA polymerase sigma factor [Ignavibacteriaceae bacterium]|nr:RNA polymerase sigma factor [Ignavibacteriaceae bacterium]
MQVLKKDQLKNLTDEELIARVREGSVEYYREIVKRYNQRMYRIAISYGVYDDDSEEVIQTAFITAYEKLEQFRGEAKFSTWLTRILINECLMLKRKKKKSISIDEIVTLPAGEHLNPESKYMDKERKKILEDAILKLPEKYKSVYILKEIEGMSIEKVAEAISISQVNVKVRLHRARTMMREFIGQDFDVTELFTFGNERCDRVADNVMDYIINQK